jgi:anti-sigma28 factor (negative regulator of flagellin synthesis)
LPQVDEALRDSYSRVELPAIKLCPLAGVIAMNSIPDVNHTAKSSPVQKLVNQPIKKQVPADAPAQLPVRDRVELSGVSHLLQSLKSGQAIRADKVAEVRAQLDAGTYETDEKLDIAADRLLDELES